jgi:hypothetical protein
MYDRFSERARTVVADAERAAHERGAREVGPEDVLIVLAACSGAAGSVLRAVAADAGLLRDALGRVEDAAGEALAPQAALPRPLHLSVDAANAFTIALREADGLRLPFVATEHLLLGLLREPSGRATRLLLAVRRDPGLVRERLLDLLSSPGFVSPEAPPVTLPVADAPAPLADTRNPADTATRAETGADHGEHPPRRGAPAARPWVDAVDAALAAPDRELLETVLDEVARLRAEIALLRAELAGIDSQADRNIA